MKLNSFPTSWPGLRPMLSYSRSSALIPSTVPHPLRSELLSITGKVPPGARSNKNAVSHKFPFVPGLATVFLESGFGVTSWQVYIESGRGELQFYSHTSDTLHISTFPFFFPEIKNRCRSALKTFICKTEKGLKPYVYDCLAWSLLELSSIWDK